MKTDKLVRALSPALVVLQVRRAQHLGAAGVIIADNTCLCSDVDSEICIKAPDTLCEQVEPIMADDGSGADIAIPRYQSSQRRLRRLSRVLMLIFGSQMTWKSFQAFFLCVC